MLIQNQNQKSILVVLLFILISIIIPFQGLKAAADDYNPDYYLNIPKIKREILRIESNTLARQTFMDNAGTFGISNNLLGFINNLSGGNYATQIDMIQNVPTQKWKPLLRGSGSIKTVRKIVNSNTRYPVTSRLAVIGSKVTNALGAVAVYADVIDAMNGNNRAKLKALYGTLELVKGHIISTYGGTNMNIAMAGVAFMSYALNKFINTTLSEYEEDWWQKYSGYLLDKYPKIDGGSKSWYKLVEEEGEEGLNRRLNEYWSNPYSDDSIISDGDALYDQTKNLQGSEYAKNMYGPSFAARYYIEYVHVPLRNRFIQQAERAEAKAALEFRREWKRLKSFIEDAEDLQAAIEIANELVKIEKLTIDPVKVNLTIGQSQTFEVSAYNKAGQKEDVSVHALQPSVEFEAKRLGTFYMNAEYEGKKAKATIIVYDPEEVNQREDDIFQEESEEDNSDLVGDCSKDYFEDLVDMTDLSIIYWKESETELLSYINSFNKEINNQTINPCNNSTISYCYHNASELATEMNQERSEIIDAVSDILVYNTVCIDLNALISGGGVQVSDLISRSSDLKSYQEEINDMTMRLLENGCDEQEVSDNGEKAVPPDEDPGFVQDGGTSVTSGGNLPSGGSGTAEQVYSQCLQSKGINPNNTEDEIQNLLNDWQTTQAAYYDGNNVDPSKCNKYKQAITDILDYYIAMRDCYIEAGYSDPNILGGLQDSIEIWSSMLAQLQC